MRRAANGQADIVQGDIGSAMLQRANQGAQAKVVSPLYGKVPFVVRNVMLMLARPSESWS